MIVKSEPIELRGIANKETKKGNVYYIVNCELADGTPLSFYCPNSDAFPSGLKKGEIITIDFLYKKFNGNEQLLVKDVHRYDGKSA